MKIRIQLLVLALAAVLGWPSLASAQTRIVATPDCVQTFTFDAAGSGVSYDNRSTACTTWTMVYQSSGFSVVSISMQQAPDSFGQPGAWVTWANLASGTQPLTSIVGDSITGYKYQPWVRVNAATLTGTGRVTGTLYGYRAGGGQNANSAPDGGTGTGAQQVQGTTAEGATTVGNPVLIGGKDATGFARMINVASSGAQAMGQATTGADGQANNGQGAFMMTNGSLASSGIKVAPMVFNGATLDQLRGGTDGSWIGVNTAGADGVAATVARPQSNAGSGLMVNPMVFNGTTMDRLKGDTKGLEVHGTRSGFSCYVTSTATTIQAFGGSCAAPGASNSLYITDVSFSTSAAAGTAADSYPTLKSGTGGTCGTGTAVVWGALAAANTAIVNNLSVPLKIAANSELCWIMSTAGTKVIVINGFIGPS
jgi:hypothetical protein